MPAHDHRLRQFVRELLRAFASTDSYACERLGARSGQLGNNRGWSSFNVAGGSITSSSIVSRRSRGGFEACAMMRRVHALCVVESISALCTLLCVPEDVPDRVAVALGNINPSTSSEIDGSRELDLQELLKCMEGIECNFLGVSRSLTRSKSNRAWVSEYQPDWRTRNLIWDLIKSLGKIQPPQECAGAFRRFKEAAFAALFKGDYLLEQRNRAGFKNTLLRHFPRPDAWDASMGWLAVSFFVSIPLANIADTLDSHHRQRAFWGTFALIFSLMSISYVLLSSKYSSYYATKLLDKAAAGMSSDEDLSFLGDDGQTEFGTMTASATANVDNMLTKRYSSMQTSMDFEDMSLTDHSLHSRTNIEIDESGLVDNAIDPCTVDQGDGHRNSDTVNTRTIHENKNGSESISDGIAVREVCVTVDETPKHLSHSINKQADESPSSGLLRLYQVSMLVERMFGSNYFDDQWAIGLTEDRLYDAIIHILTSDIALGQQFAAFSFTAVAISSKGTSLGPGSDAVSASGVRFSFGLFGLLAAAGFLCGMTSSILSDFMLRKIALTQTKDEKTSHEFAAEFGFYLRVNGGLNGFAGMFLATAVFHFLLSIFKVSPIAVVPLAAVWLLAGSVLMESFIASFAYWSLNEVFDDLGEFVDSPDLQSPSPVTGTIQILLRWLGRVFHSSSPKDD